MFFEPNHYIPGWILKKVFTDLETPNGTVSAMILLAEMAIHTKYCVKNII